jgi:predicted DNA-binding transcriptional regulator YafY
MDRSERFHKIDALLKDLKIVSMAILLKELEVSHATIKRDLEYMRDRFQAPIEWDTRRRAYYYAAGSQFALPGLWLNADEIQAFLLMEDLLAQLQPGLLRQHLAPLRTRLENLLAKGDVKMSEVRRRIRILRMPSRPVEPKHFQITCSATLSRKRLQLEYYNHSTAEETQRIVSPQRLIYYKANWYLDAWCHLRKALRSFAVDAIREATTLAINAREVRDAVLDAHLGAGYGIYAGKAKNTAVLRFTPDAARWVAREEWHSRQARKLESDGSLVLEIPYAQDYELVMDILRYGGRVEVIGPTSLRQTMEAELVEALRRYRPDQTAESEAPRSTAPENTGLS